MIMSSANNLKKSLLVLALATTLAACSDNDNDPVVEEPVVVEPIVVEPVISEFTITFSN